MAIAKVTMFFNDGLYGWTESYYYVPFVATPVGALTDAQALAQARIAMLACGPTSCGASRSNVPCNQPVLAAIRISLVGTPRNTIFWTPNGVFVSNGNLVPPFPTQGACSNTQGIGQDGSPDNPYSAMEMVCTTASGAQSKRPLSGVPDADICDQIWNNGSAWAALAKVFTTLLCGGKWGAYNSLSAAAKQAHTNATQMMSLGYTVPPTGIIYPPQDELGHPYIRLVTPINLVTNNLDPCNLHLVVYRYVPFPPTPSINGVYRAFPQVSPTGPGPALFDTFLLRKRFPALQMFCPGWVTWVQPNVDPFVSALLNRPMKRDRGRPTGLVRGRARGLRF